MKATLLKRGATPDQSFSAARHCFPHFLKVWHYHEELELVYISQSTGTRFIGDSIERFQPDELVLIGSNLPHMFQNDADYFKPGSKLQAEAHVVHFSSKFLGSDLQEIPEFHQLHQLLIDANLGIRFSNKIAEQLAGKIRTINQLEGFRSMMTFLELLGSLAADDYETIASPGFVNQFESTADDRLEKVYDHVMSHFQESISLDTVADLVNMNQASFCRYFKRTTQQTFTEFLNDIRIGFACKMLLEQRKTVLEVCYECGYNNVSHFNRQFKKKTGLAPSQYQQSRING